MMRASLRRGPPDYCRAVGGVRDKQVCLTLSSEEGACLNDLADMEGVSLPEAARRAVVRMTWLSTFYPDEVRELLSRKG